MANRVHAQRGLDRMVERPMFLRGPDGQARVEKSKTMNIPMRCDHRVVEGWDAASFAQALKRLLEAPAVLLAG